MRARLRPRPNPRTRRASPRTFALLVALVAIAIAIGACASDDGGGGGTAGSAGATGRLCGRDAECDAPMICRGNASGDLVCETPPSTGAAFGEPAYTTEDGKRTGPNCLSAIDDGNLCTRACRESADCGGKLPTCRGLPLASDTTRTVPVCQKN